MLSEMLTCEFGIEGIERVLEGAKGFRFAKADGLNVVIAGKAGTGKSILALQMAITARVSKQAEEAATSKDEKWPLNSVYLTKDTSPETLVQHIVSDFRLFGLGGEAWKPPANVLSMIQFIPADEAAIAARIENDAKPTKLNKLKESSLWDPNLNSNVILENRLPTFIYLDCLVANAYALFGSESAQKIKDVLTKEVKPPFFAVADLNLAAVAPAAFPRGAFDGPLVTTLWHLCPGLKDAFDVIAEDLADNLMVVVDSLPPPILEQCLRFQAERPRRKDLKGESKHSFSVYISEVSEVPQDLQASYPPDVQIQLDVEQREHSTRVKTLRIQKARFQRIRHEAFPFLVTGSDTTVGHADLLDVQSIASRLEPRQATHEPTDFETRSRGITILPSMSDAATCRRPMPKREIKEITFGTTSLDSMTRQGNLEGGGCTLVTTAGRCQATILGLHFLLGAIGRDIELDGQGASNQLPRSVLYITVGADLLSALYDIWRFPLLRRAIWKPDGNALLDVGQAWKKVEKEALDLSRVQHKRLHESRAWHRLYKVPLLHGRYTHRCPEPSRPGPYLYILIPDFTWCTPEEALEQVERILHFGHHDLAPCNEDDLNAPGQQRGMCLRVDRVLFNPVDQVNSRWPMIQDVTVFLSNLAQMCQSNLVDLMLIDDTPYEVERTNRVVSRWIGVAQNIIRLRRVPFHAGEAIAMELVRSPGREPHFLRPQELYVKCLPEESHKPTGTPSFIQRELRCRDAFRGYTGLFTDEPRHAEVVVDLVYDRRNSPLHRDVLNMARNLRTLVERTEVHVFGPNERPGINSALANLSKISHNSCHVVAIDEVWIHHIIRDRDEPSGLAELAGPELARALPRHVREQLPLTEEDEAVVYTAMKDQYATDAMTIAIRKAGKRETVYCMPYWNNWGVLVVSHPKVEALQRLLDLVVAAVGKKDSSIETVLKDPEELKQWGGESAIALAAVLLGEEKRIDETKGKTAAIHDVALRAYHLMHCPGSRQAEMRSDETTCFTWEHMRLFKELVWDPVANSPRMQQFLDMVRHRQAGAANPAIEEVDKWFGPHAGLYLFDCHRDRTESTVCFLLELMLTVGEMGDLFDGCDDIGPSHGMPATYHYETASLLYLRTDPGAQKVVLKALELLYRLLSDTQRRELALGLGRSTEATQTEANGQEKTPPSERMPNPPAAQKSPDRRPESYAIFAREWLSTVPTAGETEDLRARVDLRHLPASKLPDPVDRLCGVMTWPEDRSDGGRPRQQLSGELCRQLKGVGATVSGTWYLGALSGGNLDVACDIIREVVSGYHERDRLATGCAGPVTKQFYELVSVEADPDHFIPYAEIVSGLLKERNKFAGKAAAGHAGANLPTFPFCRGRIMEYTPISLELNELIRHSMLVDPLTPKDNPDAMGNEWSLDWRKRVEHLVAGTFARIERINEECRKSRSR